MLTLGFLKSKAGRYLVFSKLSLEVTGKEVQAIYQEAGGHRIQRIPPTEKRGRVHTSSVTVAAYDANTTKAPIDLNKDDLRIEWFSGTGSGGQHRNKCQNSCRVIHIATGTVETRQGRSRKTNKMEAIEALSQRLSVNQNLSDLALVNLTRASQIGQGLRGDKIRTYREKDNKVMNHLNGKTSLYREVMKGRFSELWD